MVRFGSEKLQGLFDKLGDTEIESPMVTKAITTAQERVEGQNHDIRKNLLQYDDVLRQQREVMYTQRNYVLENEDVHSIVRDMFDRVAKRVMAENADEKGKVDGEKALAGMRAMGCPEGLFTANDFAGKSVEAAAKVAADKDWNFYEDKIKEIRDSYLPFEKTIVLKNMDRKWIDHIDSMDKLRNGIHLRSYAQSQPLQQYVEEGYAMFEEMMENIAKEVVFFANRMNIEVRHREHTK